MIYEAFLNSPMEWAVVVGVLLLLFGPKKIPELARSFGQAAGELQKGIKESKDAVMESNNTPAPAPAPAPVAAEPVHAVAAPAEHKHE